MCRFVDYDYKFQIYKSSDSQINKINESSLQLFQFCPKCGSPHFSENNEKSKKCADCGFVYYFNSSAAVVAVIENPNGEILVARRAKEPAKGTLDLPGGFVDLYETAEEATSREVMEETGLSVTSVQYLFSVPNIYVYSGFEVHTLDMFFRCRVNDFNGLKAQMMCRNYSSLPGSSYALPTLG